MEEFHGCKFGNGWCEQVGGCMGRRQLKTDLEALKSGASNIAVNKIYATKYVARLHAFEFNCSVPVDEFNDLINEFPEP